MRALARALASLGPIGHVRRAPGTAASLTALLAGSAMMRRPGALPLAAAVGLVVGSLAVRSLPEASDDPPWVVVDEVVGQWIAMLGLRRGSARGLLAAFALFRMLDIVKPGPVGWADRRPGTAGVMGDDLIAGCLAAGLLAGACRIGELR